MVNRKERTIEVYKNVGAQMRLFKTMGSKLAVDISHVLSANDTDMFLRALHKIDEVCSRAEDNMFRDHPKISDEYLSVFYGDVGTAPRGDVDKTVLGMAREVADGLFEGKGY